MVGKRTANWTEVLSEQSQSREKIKVDCFGLTKNRNYWVRQVWKVFKMDGDNN